MTIDEIKELIHVVNETGITELEVQRGDNRVRIQRTHAPSSSEHLYTIPAGGPPVMAPNTAATPVSDPRTAAQSAALPTPETVKDAELVKSPIVGTFYESP